MRRSGRRGSGRGRTGSRPAGEEEDPPTFEVTAPEEETGFDDLSETKLGKKQEKIARFAGTTGYVGLDDKDVFGGIDFLSSSSDDEAPSKRAAARPQAKGAGTSKADAAGTKWLTLESATMVNYVADFRTVRSVEGATRDGGVRLDSSPVMHEPAAKHAMPEGVQVEGGEPTFDEQDDGMSALLLPEGGYLKVGLHVTPWALAEDGKMHKYTLVLAMRVDALPSAPMPLFSGGSATPHAERLDHVLLYKNGGVGALNDMGAQEAAVRAERWTWLVVTRKPGELRTYVNGRLCAALQLETRDKDRHHERDDAGAGDEADKEGASKTKQPVQEKARAHPARSELSATRRTRAAPIAPMHRARMARPRGALPAMTVMTASS